jgi:hypothetical protein
MCLATAAAIASIAGTGISAIGAMQQGAAAESAASYNAQVAENNRIIAEQNAEYAVRAGQAKAEQESLKGRAALGKIRARQGASGVTVGSPSFVDVEEGAREANVLDVANVIQNAQLEAYGYKSKATNYGAEAELSRMKGAAAGKAGKVSALGTLLSGAGSIGSKWAMMGGGGGVGGGLDFDLDTPVAGI